MKIGIAGCTGRMGQLLVREAAARGHQLIATVEPHSLMTGQDIGTLCGLEPLGTVTSSEPAELFKAEVVIDFTIPAATRRHAELARAHKVPLVIGTTGLDAETKKAIAAASEVAPVLVAANFSRGVNLLALLVEEAARRLGLEADIEIVEMHHRAKVDAPSGTALALGEAAARGRNQKLAEVALQGRDGHTGPRPTGSIGFAALRGGSVVGDHQVIFALDGERLELGHRSENRVIYAKGAVAAANWLVSQPPGLYGMQDFLKA